MKVINVKKIQLQKNFKPYLCISIFLAIFFIMFSVNFILPIEKTLTMAFRNITDRAWAWCEILISLIAFYYILKIRKFTFLDFVISIFLGIMVKYTGYSHISAFATIMCYYSACQIFRTYSKQECFDLSSQNIIKSFFTGALISIPFAIINNLAIYIVNRTPISFNVTNIIRSAWSALSPAISEECIFHFFLLAFFQYLFKGTFPKDKLTTFLLYFVCVVPHCLIHIPVIFTQNFEFGIVNLLFTALLFGTPMVWLIKNKNLETAIGFHWAIDFIRFAFVFWNNTL